MADLTYDVSELERLGSGLQRTHQNLEHDKNLKDYGRDELGHAKVASAVDDFVNDWDDKRNRLTKSVGELAEMASKSAETFSKADRDLAEALLEKDQ